MKILLLISLLFTTIVSHADYVTICDDKGNCETVWIVPGSCTGTYCTISN